ncbi:hypothetical protein [Erythrobacter sp. Alg231-14]|uniref:hypothetical protein n=1 Tax=Erythrobacter sp. Alg231-14 TaxID=1922225 RepID=UPI00307B8A47
MQIFETYNDCFAATENGSIDTAALGSLGWALARMTTDDGRDVEGAPIIFGHGERAPIILLSATEGDGFCIVMARVENSEVFDQFKQAFGSDLPDPDENGAITFFAQGHVVQIAQTGSRDEPSVRLAVGTKNGD